MKLGAKAALLAAVAGTIALAGFVGPAGFLLLNDFRDADVANAQSEMARLEALIALELVSLENDARGVADVAGALLAGDVNGTVSNETLQVFYSIFAVDKVDVVFVSSDDGNVTFAFGFNRTSFAFDQIDASLNATVGSALKSWALGPGQTASGLFLGENGTYLVGATSFAFEQGNVSSMAIGKLMGPEFMEGFRDIAGRDVSAGRADGAGFTSKILSSTQLRASTTLNDPNGEPVLTLTIVTERHAYQEGRTNLGYVGLAAATVIAIVVVGFLISMRALVTGRVTRLESDIAEIQTSGELGRRVADAGNDEVAALAVAFNGLMTTLEQNEADLQQTNEDLDNFARSVSHDLRSPLTTFKLNLRNIQLFAKDGLEPQQQAALDRMIRGVETMSERIDAMLAYSRSRTTALDLIPVRLDDVVVRVQESLQAEIEATQAMIRIGPLPIVMADAQLMDQVLQNLISNAIKYARPGKRPAVWVHAEGAHLIVEDRGRGFTKEQAETVFAAFTRLDNSVGVQGMGVGLATVARIMERLGGTIEAQGKPGVGARFLIWLPQA